MATFCPAPSAYARRGDSQGMTHFCPKEVETEINRLDGVVELAIIGVPHPDFGEAVVAVMVGADGHVVEAGDIKAALSDRLAKFKCPKEVFVVAELPRSTMGKVQKNLLRETYKNTFE